MSLLDFSPRIPLGTFSILLCNKSVIWLCTIMMKVQWRMSFWELCKITLILLYLRSSSHTLGIRLISKSKTNSIDYHDEMNGSHFLEWFNEVLIPALPLSSVMDNAPYHNIRAEYSIYPTSNNMKQAIISWLQQKSINADNREVKVRNMKSVNTAILTQVKLNLLSEVYFCNAIFWKI